MNSLARRRLAHPALLFAVGWAALLGILFAPLFAGGVLANPMSDAKDGYVTRHFAAEIIRRWGEIPRWDPYIFGGLPFLGAMHGDQAYPISIALRAVFPPAMGIGLGIVFHLWLAPVGLLVFLRRLRLPWGAASVGATAYGIGGPLIGLLFPGHDGKIYVLGLLPWALTAILEASRTARPIFFAAWGLVLGLMLLSPHFQLAYYSSLLLIAFLVRQLLTETSRPFRFKVLAGMAVGSLAGVFFAGAQLLPFVEYLPFSPRSAAGSSSTGWEHATSWAMPAPELIGAVWGGFNGWLGTYWGSNPFKLHSDYVGLLVGVLAVGALWRRRSDPMRGRALFWAGVVFFGTLWALGAQTPFYRLPYSLLPLISKTRAPNMMWGPVSLALSVLAALGFQRLQTMPDADRIRWAKRAAIGTAAAAILLAAMSGSLIPNLAPAEHQDAAFAAVSGAQWGILLGALSVVAFAFVAWKAPRWMAPAAVALILLDLNIQDHRFIVIDPRGDSLFQADSVVRAMETDAAGATQPWRVLPAGAYLDDYLIEHRIRSVLGYHGNQLHRYDELLGGHNVYAQLGNPQLWRLLAVRYILTDRPISVPGLIPVASAAPTWLGDTAWVWRVPSPAPWAQVVPVAIRASDEDIQKAVLSPGFDAARLVLVSKDAPFGTSTLPSQMPAPINPAPQIRVAEGRPGQYSLTLSGLSADGVLFVSENWFPNWRAIVNGRPAPVARANATFLAVPVAAGTTRVVLTLEAVADRRGRYASLAGLVLLIALALGDFWRRRSSRPTEIARAA
ncbi:MAG: hypothetical protein ABR585_02350 [Gemmatimonadaceae bacterium]